MLGEEGRATNVFFNLIPKFGKESLVTYGQLTTVSETSVANLYVRLQQWLPAKQQSSPAKLGVRLRTLSSC